MALLDENKLQGNIINILNILRKEVECCKVVSALWAKSSEVATGVFITVDQNGGIKVYDAPGGNLLTPAEYGTLEMP